MKAILSALQLDSYVIDSVSVESNDSYTPDHDRSVIARPRISIGVEGAEDRTYVTLVVYVDEESCPEVPWDAVPYRIRLLIMGDFSVAEDVEKKQTDYLVNFAGPAVLYGIARRIVSGLTQCAPYGEYLLPSIDLSAMGRKYVEDHGSTQQNTAQKEE